MENIVDLMEDPIAFINNDGIINYINKSFKNQFSTDAVSSLKELFNKGDRGVFFGNFLKLSNSENGYRSLMHLIDKHGNIVPCYLHSFKYRNYICVKITNISFLEQRISVSSYETSRFMESLTQGMAHSLRNPLMAVGGMINRIKKNVPEDCAKYVFPYVSVIDKEIMKVMHIVLGVETINNSFPSSLKRINLYEIVKSIADKYKNIKKGIKFNFKQIDNIELFFNEKHLRFILEEIIKNACDAYTDGGTISINIEKVKNDCFIEIEDNGVGMKAEDIPIAFVPFYSTKPHNAGMGLSMAKALTERYGGKISIDSKIGEGSKVRLSFPIERRGNIRRKNIEYG